MCIVSYTVNIMEAKRGQLPKWRLAAAQLNTAAAFLVDSGHLFRSWQLPVYIVGNRLSNFSIMQGLCTTHVVTPATFMDPNFLNKSPKDYLKTWRRYCWRVPGNQLI